MDTSSFHSSPVSSLRTDGVQRLVAVLRRAVMGDGTVRILLDVEHLLWPLVEPLNVLLARYATARKAEEELERTRTALTELTLALHTAHQCGDPFVWPATSDTAVDVLVRELRHIGDLEHEAHSVHTASTALRVVQRRRSKEVLRTMSASPDAYRGVSDAQERGEQ